MGCFEKNLTSNLSMPWEPIVSGSESWGVEKGANLEWTQHTVTHKFVRSRWTHAYISRTRVFSLRNRHLQYHSMGQKHSPLWLDSHVVLQNLFFVAVEVICNAREAALFNLSVVGRYVGPKTLIKAGKLLRFECGRSSRFVSNRKKQQWIECKKRGHFDFSSEPCEGKLIGILFGWFPALWYRK